MAILGEKNFWSSRARLPRIAGSSAKKNLRSQPSKTFQTSNSVAVASGGVEHVTIKSRDAEAEQYAPFTDLIISNSSNCDIFIWVNQDDSNKLFVASNQTIAFQTNELGGHYTGYSIEVLNGVALAVSDVRCQHFHRGETADKLINRAVRILK